MTDAVEKEEEPSIEEILDSIRQIISDDDEPSDSQDSQEGDEPADDAPEEDVLELTEKAEPDPPEDQDEPEGTSEAESESEPEPVAAEEEPEAEPEPEPDSDPDQSSAETDIEIDMQDAEELPPTEEPEPVPEDIDDPEPDIDFTDSDSAVTEEADMRSLLTERAEAAAVEGFSELTRRAAVENGGITLEEITRTELRPLLRDWLDTHLPVLIERLVQDELEKISKRVLGDL